ncbi:MAG: hypothetical protein RMJ87_10200 [Cytophagales bacterium]|nr:hypothetical protein [Bernardetiaceae bacterium]MDW8205390.1 hypothetical protein [Cytophagales bacterium]
MNRWFAQLLSVVLHPSLMGTYLCALALFWGPAEFTQYSESVRMLLVEIVFIITFLIPTGTVIFLRQRGVVKDLTLPKREDRFAPFLVSLFAYGGAAYYFFVKLPQVFLLPAIMTTICLAILATLLLTLFVCKVSAHATGISGVAGALISLQQLFPESAFFYPLIGVILLWGLVLSARLALQAHSLSELLAGSAVGFTVCYISLLALAQ